MNSYREYIEEDDKKNVELESVYSETGEYFEEDDKTNVKLESIYSEENVSYEGKESGEYFEEDDKTNMKIEEQDFKEEYTDIEKRIPNESSPATFV